MSGVGPLGGIPASAAGAPLSQARGSDAERNAQDVNSSERKSKSADKAEMAAGIGQTEEDQGTSERDADGRRLWEEPAGAEAATEQEEQSSDETDPHSDRPTTKDARGQTGNQIDLTG
jgi:hypothetical protein